MALALWLPRHHETWDPDLGTFSLLRKMPTPAISARFTAVLQQAPQSLQCAACVLCHLLMLRQLSASVLVLPEQVRMLTALLRGRLLLRWRLATSFHAHTAMLCVLLRNNFRLWQKGMPVLVRAMRTPTHRMGFSGSRLPMQERTASFHAHHDY